MNRPGVKTCRSRVRWSVHRGGAVCSRTEEEAKDEAPHLCWRRHTRDSQGSEGAAKCQREAVESGVPFPTTHHLDWTSIQHAQLEHAAGEQGLHAAERDTHRSLAEEWPRWGVVSAGAGSHDRECPHAKTRGLGDRGHTTEPGCTCTHRKRHVSLQLLLVAGCESIRRQPTRPEACNKAACGPYTTCVSPVAVWRSLSLRGAHSLCPLTHPRDSRYTSSAMSDSTAAYRRGEISRGVRHGAKSLVHVLRPEVLQAARRRRDAPWWHS